MKVLMFGWEFPPNNRGGLGTACYGLTKGLANNGVDVTFVMPKGKSEHDHVDIITTNDLYIGNKKIKFNYIDSTLLPYITESEYEESMRQLMFGDTNSGELYGKNLFEEVYRYSEKARIIAVFEDFDVIHCHDWMTFKAGINAKNESGKPLVVHVHATDFDRTGGRPNQTVYDIEREGMHAADKIIAVSNYTKSMLVEHYGVSEDKVEVVHNAVEQNFRGKKKRRKIKSKASSSRKSKIQNQDPVVLFLGRLTLQKGPEYFIETANKVLNFIPNTKFVVAGSGEMYGKMIDHAASLGIGRNVLFTGHLRGGDVDKAYEMADLYVMPSVSEPFGITPLESLKNETPVLISKQSGVSEVLPNSLKVDFWDTDEMTNKIVSVLRYNNLHSSLQENGKRDVQKLNWNDAAKKCANVYSNVCAG